MQENQLTKENASTIIVELGKITDFHNYKLFFLKTPIIYDFKKPVSIKRSKYSMLLSGIHEKDRNILESLFARLSRQIEISEAIYIAFKERDENQYDDDSQWMIQVEIKGFKKSINSVGVIWKIKNIEKKKN